MHIKIEFYLWSVCSTQNACTVRKQTSEHTHSQKHTIAERSRRLLNTMAMKCDRAIIHVLMTAFTTFISKPATTKLIQLKILLRLCDTIRINTFYKAKKKKTVVLVTLISHLLYTHNRYARTRQQHHHAIC